MQLSEKEERFLAKRTRLAKVWSYAGIVLLAVLVGITGIIIFFASVLINPFAVMARLKGNTLPPSTMALWASQLPQLFLLYLLSVWAWLLFVFFVFSNERKYLAIIRRITMEADVAPDTVLPAKDTLQPDVQQDGSTDCP